MFSQSCWKNKCQVRSYSINYQQKLAFLVVIILTLNIRCPAEAGEHKMGVAGNRLLVHTTALFPAVWGRGSLDALGVPAQRHIRAGVGATACLLPGLVPGRP